MKEGKQDMNIATTAQACLDGGPSRRSPCTALFRPTYAHARCGLCTQFPVAGMALDAAEATVGQANALPIHSLDDRVELLV